MSFRELIDLKDRQPEDGLLCSVAVIDPVEGLLEYHRKVRWDHSSQDWKGKTPIGGSCALAEWMRLGMRFLWIPFNEGASISRFLIVKEGQSSFWDLPVGAVHGFPHEIENYSRILWFKVSPRRSQSLPFGATKVQSITLQFPKGETPVLLPYYSLIDTDSLL